MNADGLLTGFRCLWLFVSFLNHFEYLAVLRVVILLVLLEIHPANNALQLRYHSISIIATLCILIIILLPEHTAG